jgi:DNA primase
MLEGLMSRGIKCITIIPDNDTAGLRGAAASLALLKGREVKTLVLELPEHYKDLDEFLRHEGMELFEKLAGQVIHAENWDVQALLSRRSNIKVQIKSADKNRTAHTYYINRGNPYRQK